MGSRNFDKCCSTITSDNAVKCCYDGTTVAANKETCCANSSVSSKYPSECSTTPPPDDNNDTCSRNVAISFDNATKTLTVSGYTDASNYYMGNDSNYIEDLTEDATAHTLSYTFTDKKFKEAYPNYGSVITLFFDTGKELPEPLMAIHYNTKGNCTASESFTFDECDVNGGVCTMPNISDKISEHTSENCCILDRYKYNSFEDGFDCCYWRARFLANEVYEDYESMLNNYEGVPILASKDRLPNDFENPNVDGCCAKFTEDYSKKYQDYNELLEPEKTEGAVTSGILSMCCTSNSTDPQCCAYMTKYYEEQGKTEEEIQRAIPLCSNMTDPCGEEYGSYAGQVACCDAYSNEKNTFYSDAREKFSTDENWAKSCCTLSPDNNTKYRYANSTYKDLCCPYYLDSNTKLYYYSKNDSGQDPATKGHLCYDDSFEQCTNFYENNDYENFANQCCIGTSTMKSNKIASNCCTALKKLSLDDPSNTKWQNNWINQCTCGSAVGGEYFLANPSPLSACCSPNYTDEGYGGFYSPMRLTCSKCSTNVQNLIKENYWRTCVPVYIIEVGPPQENMAVTREDLTNIYRGRVRTTQVSGPTYNIWNDIEYMDTTVGLIYENYVEFGSIYSPYTKYSEFVSSIQSALSYYNSHVELGVSGHVCHSASDGCIFSDQNDCFRWRSEVNMTNVSGTTYTCTYNEYIQDPTGYCDSSSGPYPCRSSSLCSGSDSKTENTKCYKAYQEELRKIYMYNNKEIAFLSGGGDNYGYNGEIVLKRDIKDIGDERIYAPNSYHFFRDKMNLYAKGVLYVDESRLNSNLDLNPMDFDDKSNPNGSLSAGTSDLGARDVHTADDGVDYYYSMSEERAANCYLFWNNPPGLNFIVCFKATKTGWWF